MGGIKLSNMIKFYLRHKAPSPSPSPITDLGDSHHQGSLSSVAGQGMVCVSDPNRKRQPLAFCSPSRPARQIAKDHTSHKGILSPSFSSPFFLNSFFHFRTFFVFRLFVPFQIWQLAIFLYFIFSVLLVAGKIS